MMRVTNKALDRVDYGTMDCCERFNCHDEGPGSSRQSISVSPAARPPVGAQAVKGKHARSLVEIAALVVVKDEDLIAQALQFLPHHLTNILLRVALQLRKYLAVSILVSEWPMESLQLRKIYPEGRKDLFSQTMEADTALFMGLMRREEVPGVSKMKYLDLRGFHINEVFGRVLVGAFPLLSIRREDRCVKKLTDELLKFLATESPDTALENGNFDSLEDDLKPIIETKLEQFSNGYIHVPEGEALVIQVDKLEFGRENGKYMEYLMMGGLRHLTPCCVEAYNLYVDTHLQENERIVDSCAPFLALLGQDPQILQGLSLNNMEDMLFQYILRGVARFTKLKALDIGNCNISIIGKTRVRAALRSWIVYLFGSFTNLIRLDLKKSELTGHLGELLGSLKTPLEYLNLNQCTLGEDDLHYLSHCQHTDSIRELHLSSLTHLGSVKSPNVILDILNKFTKNLCVLEIQNNEFASEHANRLCEIMPSFRQLKILDIMYNFLCQDSLLRLVESCTACRTMHCLAVNLLPIFGSDLDMMDRRTHFQGKCEEILRREHRKDMSIFVVALGIE